MVTIFGQDELVMLEDFIQLAKEGEDVDVSVRLIAHKWLLYYEPLARVTHCYRKNLKDILKQFLWYGRGKPYLFIKHSCSPRRMVVFWYSRHREHDQTRLHLNSRRVSFWFPFSGFVNMHSILVVTIRKVIIAILLMSIACGFLGLVKGIIITAVACLLIGVRDIVTIMKHVTSARGLALIVNSIVPFSAMVFSPRITVYKHD